MINKTFVNAIPARFHRAIVINKIFINVNIIILHLIDNYHLYIHYRETKILLPCLTSI